MAAAKPTVAEINHMNKDQLKLTLKSIVKEIDSAAKVPATVESSDQVVDLLKQILNEVKGEKVEREKLQEKVNVLEQKNSALMETVTFQQRFLEYLDGEKRAQFVIMTSVPEDSEMKSGSNIANSDVEKTAMIFGKIGHGNTNVVAVHRLGTRNENNRSRPVKVTLADPKKRKQVLSDAKNLKTADVTFNKIYLKRDMHPSFRKEMGRLHQSFKNEKDKAENQGRDVQFDPQNRVVTVDDNIVDRFNPTHFH